MTLIKVSYPDRGFARIHPLTHKFGESIKQQCISQLSSVYEFEESGSDIWLRSRERKTGQVIDFIEELALIDADNNHDATWMNGVEKYYNNFSNQIAVPDHPVEIMRDIATQDLAKQIYQSSFALFHTHSSLKAAFLKGFYFPWFFGLFPKGKILALKLNHNYESRLALLRLGNIFSIYEESEIPQIINLQDRIRTMADLHNTGIINVKPYFLAISNLFFPYGNTYVVGSYGYIFILFTNQDDMLDRGAYPQSMNVLHESYDLMKGDMPDLRQPHSIRDGWYGRYVPPAHYSADDLVTLFRHFITRYNHNLRMRLDPTNYRIDNDIDFVAAFEEYLTFDRITLEMINCQTATKGYGARSSSFAILDKFQELLEIPSVGRDKIFHALVGKPYQTQHLKPILKNYPEPFSSFFQNESDRIYDSLYKTILGNEGLWMTYRRKSTGIATRIWDGNLHMFTENSDLINDDEFVGEIVRVIRNTHHGYLSDHDKRKRVAIFLSMHSCKLPDEFTAIPQLIWLAVIQDPESTILPNCISDYKLTSALI
ncbi:MAG: hypothetical protein ACHQQQ_05005 [Bacteroidota bacterium]